MSSKSLSKNAIFNIIYRLLNVVFPLLSYAYVARVLLSDGVGVASAVQTNVSYFIILATLGIPAYGLREIAKVRDDFSKRNTLTTELLILNSFLTLFSIVCFLISIFLIPHFSSNRILYLVYGVAIVLNFINVDWLYQGMEEYSYIAIRSTIVKILSLLFTILFVKSKNDILVFALISVVAISGNNIFNIIHSRHLFKPCFKNVNLRRHIKPLLFLALCSISTELYARMDITMLDYMSTSYNVGYYTYAHRIILLIVTTLVAVTSVFLPRLSNLFENNRDEFNALLKKGSQLMIFISIPACVGIFILAEPLTLLLLGNDFYGSIDCLKVLSFMIPLKCIGDIVCYQVMLCARRESTLMKSYFLIMVVNFLCNYLLIPIYGAVGASIASVLSEILAFIFVYFFSKKYLKNALNLKAFVGTTISSFIMGILVFKFSRIVIPRTLLLVFCVLVGIIIYLFANAILGNPAFLELNAQIKRYFSRKRNNS